VESNFALPGLLKGLTVKYDEMKVVIENPGEATADRAMMQKIMGPKGFTEGSPPSKPPGEHCLFTMQSGSVTFSGWVPGSRTEALEKFLRAMADRRGGRIEEEE
jgi:hypothetical protein